MLIVLAFNNLCVYVFLFIENETYHKLLLFHLRAGLHYGGEDLQSVKNAWPRHNYMRQMVDMPEKN
jgi:hypothetical protein